MHDNDDLYETNRREWLATLGASGLTLAVLALAGYYAPSLLALAMH